LHKDALVNLGKAGRLRQETEQAATEGGFPSPALRDGFATARHAGAQQGAGSQLRAHELD
jgi:hypothetical protein